MAAKNSGWSEIKNFLLSLSAANLLFLPIWNLLLGKKWYYDVSDISYSPLLLPVTILLVLLCGVFFYLINRLEEQFKNIFLTGFLTFFYVFCTLSILTCALIDYFFNHQLFHVSATIAEIRVFFGFIDRWIKVVFFIIFLGFFCWCIAINIHKSLKFIKNAWLIFVPFLLVTFGQALYLFALIHFYTNAGPVPYLEVKESQPRIALLLFDELDMRAAFDQRPQNLKLENLDAFKDQSFFAKKAFAAGPMTCISIPALLTGLPIAAIKFTAHDQAELTLTSNQKQLVLNQNTPSLFSRARDLGYNCGIKGFYHPYYKLFGPSLSQCDVKPIYSYSFYDASSYITHEIFNSYVAIYESIFPELKNLLDPVKSVDLHILIMVQKDSNTGHELDQEALHKNLVAYWSGLLLNKKLNLSFVHFPYPHPPAQYNYEKDKFCRPDEGSYLGNLKMVDKTIADIRQHMTEASLWDETTIIITSDHWLRKYWPSYGYNFNEDELKFVTSIDHRVPFIIKLANQKEPIVFDEPFNTVLVHDIILEIAKGTIKNPQELSLWIQQNKDKVPLEVAEELEN